MEIRAKSVYTKEAMKKFAVTTYTQVHLPLFITLDVLYFLIILAATHSIIAAVIFLIIMTLVIIITCAVAVNQQYKLLGKFQNAENYYLFRDNDFTCSGRTVDGGCLDQAVISYSFPIKVIETNNYLYIYIQKNRAFIIDKSTIENGTIDNIRCKFMPVLGKKYKIIK